MKELFTMQGVAAITFLVAIGATLGGALLATTTRRLIHSVIGLALCYFGIAGLACYLKCPFVGLMTILIYVGAVCVTIVFGIMLAGLARNQPNVPAMSLQMAGVAIVGAALAWAIVRLCRATAWHIVARADHGTIEDIGRAFLTTHNLVFILISIVLLIVILGALVVVGSGRTKR